MPAKKNIFLSLSLLLFFVSCKDSDNQVTPVAPVAPSGLVTIGNQVWTSKNLDVITYRNGDTIPEVQDPTDWSNLTIVSGAWCYYNNDPSNGSKYGKLYNWAAVNDSRGLAPAGYHIASDAEWTILGDYLGGAEGGKMKTTGTAYWLDPNTSASNSSGFSGFPGGFRNDYGTFNNIRYHGNWWSSTQSNMNNNNPWYYELYYWSGYLSRYTNYNRRYALSVRCVAD